jgi:hypothetical protein
MFQRYQNGEMSDGAQHDFEKRLLHDPAFAEAYEGFVMLNEKTNDFETISNSLAESLEKRVGVQSKSTLPLWTYASAAALLVTIGTLWIVFTQKKGLPQRTESLIIKNEHVAVDPLPEVSPEREKGAAKRLSVPERSTLAPPAKPNTNLPATPKSDNTQLPAYSSQESLQSDNAKERIATVQPVPSAFPALPQSKAMLRRPAAQTNPSHSTIRLVSGTVLDGEGNAIPGAVISDFRSEQVVTDLKGVFRIPAKVGDSLQLALVGYDPKTVNIKNTELGNIQLQEDPRSPEQVVIGYAAVQNPKKTNVAAGAVASDEKPVPRSGWLQYHAYLQQNSSFDGDETLIVSFLVKANGELADFKVSGNSTLRERAIRIVRTGPLWQPALVAGEAKDAPATVTIHFHSNR